MSGLIYACGFQVGGTNTMAVKVGAPTATVADGYYMAGDLTTASVLSSDGSAWQGQAYTSFATAVKSALDTATGTVFTVSWSHVTGLYTITRSTTFTLTFSTAGAAGTRLAAALGLSGDVTSTNISGTWTVVSTAPPVYTMVSAIGARTGVQGPTEPDDIAEESVTEGGVDHVVTRKQTELRSSWSQSMEPRSAIYYSARQAASLLWSWQEFFRHVRGTHPIWVGDALEGEEQGAFYRLTAKGAAMKPVRVTADFDDQWSVPFDARWLGYYT